MRLRLSEGRTPGSGVGVSVRAVGLGLLVGPLHGAVGDGGRGSGQRGFGEQPGNFSSGFLAVVLQQTVTLGALFALVVEAVVARDGGQVTVLWPDGRGKRVQAELGLAGLAALLQELINGQRGLFDQTPALVVWSQIHKDGLTLFYQSVQLWVDHKRKSCISVRHFLPFDVVCNCDIKATASTIRHTNGFILLT